MPKQKTSLILFAAVLSSAFIFSILGFQLKTLAAVNKKCSVTISPEQSLQETINDVQSGSVICLGKGRWNEGVAIDKSLTIRGLGDKSEIYRARPNVLTIYAKAEADLVKLQNLKVSSYARGYGARPIVFGETSLVIKDCEISQEKKSRKWGLLFAVSSSKQKRALGLKVSDTSFNNVGVSVFPAKGTTEALIQDSAIRSDFIGLQVGKFRSDKDNEYGGPRAKVTIDGCLIKGEVRDKESGMGFSRSDGAVVEIVNSRISDFPNEGIQIIGTGEAIVKNSIIKANGGNGITLKDFSQTTVTNSRIIQNKGAGILISSLSRYAGDELSGKLLYGRELLPSNIDAAIGGNEISRNGGYGIAISTGKCDLKEETEAVGFWGSIIGSHNKIVENKRGEVCPNKLSFLSSKEEGRYP